MATETTLNTILNSPEIIKTLNKYGSIELTLNVDKTETRAEAVYNKLKEDGVIIDKGTPEYYGMSVSAGVSSSELNCGIHNIRLYTFNGGKLSYNLIEVKSDVYKNDFVNENMLDGTNGTTYMNGSTTEYEFSNLNLYNYTEGLKVSEKTAETANISLDGK